MTDTILSHQLPHALELAPAGVNTLSLDCFDTLLWRHVHLPKQVFADLGGGFSVQQRIWAESQARSAATLRSGRNEVSIAEIYRELMLNADEAKRGAAVQAELDAEARHCYGFAPTVALMRAAKARGLDVIIVSDTYLDADQLGELIRAAAGEEVRGLIDRIFCSSHFGASKSEGLFKHVLREIAAQPGQILHIGDNKKADFLAARALGINALHLAQFEPVSEQRFRLEAAIQTMVEGRQLAWQPHRPAVSEGIGRIENPAERLGYAVLGPILAEFANWLGDEAEALASATDGKVHKIFLMRDGFLPQKIFEAMFPGARTEALEISRFCAIAGSLGDEAAVLALLDREIEGGDYQAIARQLLLPDGEAAAVIARLPQSGRAAAFAAAMRSRARTTIRASRAFADRLAAYIAREIRPERGDAVMLVDLGYNGTVQNHLAPLLETRFGVSVTGRYLLLREQDVSGCDKKGLLDARAYDGALLEAFSANVAMLEQLCTAAVGSVVDYKADGEPVRSKSSIKGRQSAIRDDVQQGCLRYAGEHRASVVRPPSSDCEETRRSAVAAILGRMMFLPLPEELAVVASFDHDVNLGFGATVPLFDPEVAVHDLRRRGLFYAKGVERMYLPAELRGQGMPLSLAYFASRRFGLELKHPDFCDDGIDLPILVADGSEVVTDIVRAHPTHDGYFSAAIPIGDCRFAIGVQFGKLYEWVQVESAEFQPVEHFLSDRGAILPRPVPACPSLEGMEQVAPHLMRCEDAQAFMMVQPPRREDDRPMMLAVAFRPIAARQPATLSVESQKLGETAA